MGNKIRMFFAIAFMAAAVSCTAERDKYIKIEGYAQGGVYVVTLNLKGVDVRPAEIRDSVESILHRIDFTLSGYNKNSLISAFNQGDTIVPNGLFADMYARAYCVYNETQGIVDAASAPLFDMWGFGFKSGEMPSDEDVQKVLAHSGMRRLRADIEAGTPLAGKDLLLEGEVPPQLNYNAIAQGYSCDLVAGYLYSIGVKDMMVNIGEIFCDGLNPSGQPWTVGIDRPVDGNNEPGAQVQGIFKAPSGPHGIVTSGNYRKFYVRDGKKYAHTIDPRTGYPVSHGLLSATILADDAITADAYATYCMVVGLEESKALLAMRPDLEGCLIYDQDGEFLTWCSDGFVLTEM